MSTDDGVTEHEHRVKMSKWTLLDRVKRGLRFLWHETPTFASVALSLVGVAQVLIVVAGRNPDLVGVVAPSLAVALVVAGYRATTAARNFVPDALVPEPPTTHAAYRRHGYGWQWMVAYYMLSERIRVPDATLDRIRRGSEFVEPRRIEDAEYIDWLTSRPAAIIRLLEAVTAHVTYEVPRAVARVVEDDQLSDMTTAIDALAALYEKSVEFERECAAVVPPERFQTIHDATHGWTDPIRSGIHEFLSISKQLGQLEPKRGERNEVERPSFNIVIEEAPQVNEFCRRLDMVQFP